MSATRRPTIILTGGSRGIGLSCLKVLLKSPIGANVVSLSRSFPPELQELKKSHHHNLLVVQGNVAKDEDNKLAVDSAIKSFGSIDGLILNSGMIKFERIDDPNSSSIESWKEVFDVNFFSLVSILKHSLTHLRESKGKVIFISSGASVGGIASWGSYNTSKAALNSLCRTLASEEPTITSIALRPGVVDTEMQAQLRSEGKEIMNGPNYKHFHGLYETSKLVKPEGPAEVIANLSIQADAKLSGQFLSWDSEELASYRETPSLEK
ncbi:hypothetical protein Pst134EA_009522 [Puccinia striiformis f. sp. tritici]|uniref:Short-chain dehydrogenase n=1 Tax=Puccinia striiformis f. sp. tritici PST-78 TaxID=1165861 RepID=A0A0L0US19_9BASI|nr:hypothetical protein Pst134EA_009522 [Puccinia striiformis f. sp. tritici]KAH9469002.1 hypothetical protein Pst134EA_009522 [Puccinia striiformis f. sp. tritici]KNE89873.1 hypothetical protein PSTG_16659 [Puccinia striiformis f. sp. tritici PST-78]